MLRKYSQIAKRRRQQVSPGPTTRRTLFVCGFLLTVNSNDTDTGYFSFLFVKKMYNM